MKLTLKSLALALALVMALGAGAYAQETSYFITVTDPYITDGMTVYDLTGLTATLELNSVDDVTQAVLSIITQAGKISGYATIDANNAYLFADGLSSLYTISLEKLLLKLSGAKLGNITLPTFEAGDVTIVDPRQTVAQEVELSDLVINDMLNGLYVAIMEGTSEMLASAEPATVDTLTKQAVDAMRAPIALDEAMVDDILTQLAKSVDDRGLYQKALAIAFEELLADGLSAAEIESQLPATCVDFYGAYIKPFRLNITGEMYASDMSAYIQMSLNSSDISVVPFAIEVNAGDAPSLNAVLEMAEGEELMQLKFTAEGGESTFIEFGMVMNDAPILSARYTRELNAEYGEDLYHLYISAVDDGTQVEMSGQYMSDDESFRMMYLGMSMNGVALEFEYNSSISTLDNYLETAQLELNTNIGIEGRLGLAFGEGQASLAQIPDTIPSIDISAMTDEQAAQFETDIQTVTSMALMYLLYGVPGFGALMQSMTGGVQ